MEVGIYTFAQKHGRDIGKVGSSVIRGQWLVNHWPEAELYQEGKKYDAVIFQKVWWPQLYESLDCIKILDLCDPEWLQADWPIMKIAELVDAIVVSSEGLYNALKDMVSIPVVWIDDRIDLDFIGEFKKNHTGDAKKVGWFGYHGNGDNALQPTLFSIASNNLELKIISDRDISFFEYDNIITNVPHSWETIIFELLECDFILNPAITSPYSIYKSKNKTYLAWALGLPVAHNATELTKFISEENRAKEAERVYKLVRDELDVTLSVKQYKELLKKIWEKRDQ